jgi:hypothetical protein
LTGIVQAQQVTNFDTFIQNVRANLELAANEALGEGVRPDGWTFNLNRLESATYLADLWFDTELLATNVSGTERPAGWIGAPVTADVQVVARNLAHDLEQLANQIFGPNNRPADWRSTPALVRCDRTLMNTTLLLTVSYKIRFTTTEDNPNYCATIADEAQSEILKLLLSNTTVETRLPDLILAVRGDLERLADEELGVNTRPSNWIGNKDRESPNLLSDSFLDLETLANLELGVGNRPPGWLSILPGAPLYAYQYLRFNLELLANTLVRIPRPRGWQGVDLVQTCGPDVQNLVSLADLAYNFSSEETPAEGNFCQQLSLAVNAIVESPPEPEDVLPGDDAFVYEADYAFTYLDVAATQYMGVMPGGTQFKAWYRNFGDSTMMFVSGELFAVFIDRRWTSMPEDVFLRLPTLEGVKPLTFCDAAWCNGPGPTPTPTGGGAIQALLNQGTPPAAPDVSQLAQGKTQVSWNFIRVTYVQDNAATRTAQVTLEICSDTSQTECEPVSAIYDQAIGTQKPVLSQFNGLNVYEFPYGYTSNLIIESETRFSPDVWISDPTIR